jgi:hypothetical protein
MFVSCVFLLYLFYLFFLPVVTILFSLVSYIIFFFSPSFVLFLNWQSCEHVKTCSVLSYNPLALTLAMLGSGLENVGLCVFGYLERLDLD